MSPRRIRPWELPGATNRYDPISRDNLDLLLRVASTQPAPVLSPDLVRSALLELRDWRDVGPRWHQELRQLREEIGPLRTLAARHPNRCGPMPPDHTPQEE